MNSDVESEPVNIGSKYEFTILEFAKIVRVSLTLSCTWRFFSCSLPYVVIVDQSFNADRDFDIYYRTSSRRSRSRKELSRRGSSAHFLDFSCFLRFFCLLILKMSSL